jgi:hypothetical protein
VRRSPFCLIGGYLGEANCHLTGLAVEPARAIDCVEIWGIVPTSQPYLLTFNGTRFRWRLEEVWTRSVRQPNLPVCKHWHYQSLVILLMLEDSI